MYFLYNDKKNACKLAALFFTIFLIAYPGYSQKAFRTYTAGDGLISNYPQQIFQDEDGFIWLGSNEGLSIYNGFNFVNYTLENGGLTGNVVNGIFKKSEDEIWVIHDNGIDIFVKRKLIKTLPIHDLNMIIRTHDNKLFGEGYHGIYEINGEKSKKLFAYHKVFDVLFEAGNFFLAKDFADSILLFDKTMKYVCAAKKPGRLFKDRFDRFWLADSKQIYLLDTLAFVKGIIRLLPPPGPLNQLQHGYITGFFIDADSSYWLSIQHKGVIYINKRGETEIFNLPNGLSSNLLLYYFEDAEKNMWVIGNGGAIKFFSKSTRVFSESDGLASNHVSSIAYHPVYHSLWIAEMNGISCLYKNKIYNFPYPDNQICTWTKLALQGDSLWVGFNGLWLYKVQHDPKPHLTLLRNWFPYPGKETPENGVSDMHLYKNSIMLVNFYDNGLFYVDRKNNLKEIVDGRLFFTFLIAGDELWSGGIDAGMAYWKIFLDKGSLFAQQIKRNEHLPDDRIRTIGQDQKGYIWMGTSTKGLLRFDKQKSNELKIINYNEQHGLMCNSVTKILVSRSGHVYAGTKKGLFILNILQDSIYCEDLSRKYGFSNEIYDIKEGANGEIWLGTPAGVIQVKNNPSQKIISPKVFFTQLIRHNHVDSGFNFSSGSHIFSYSENNLTFEFTSTSFRNEEQNLFSYKLEKDHGNSVWSTPQKSHTLSFVSLSAGEYSLYVKALSADNAWSEIPAKFSFTIRPPFWATWWFRVLLLLFVTIIIVAIVRYRINQLRKLMALRLKISRDLHDEIGSTLSGIGLISEMAIQQLENKKGSDVKSSLNKISSNAEEMLGKMSDIVWAINPRNDDFEKMISRLQSFAKNTASPLGIQVYFESEKDLQYRLDMQRRNNIYLICKEAINNAIKYSGCTNLNFVLKQEDHSIHISIEDDGKGFDVQEVYEGNGLINMRSRAKEIKANLEIRSEKEKGTFVRLLLKTT